MNPIIILTRENLHALSTQESGDGFTRAQIELLGFSWPPQKGWLSSLIGQKMTLEKYEDVRRAALVKAKALRREKKLNAGGQLGLF